MLLLVPSCFYGQVRLCGECATAIMASAKSKRCCEECMHRYFVKRLKENVTTMPFREVADYKDVDSLLSMPETISGLFQLVSVEQVQGFQLNADDQLTNSSFYLMEMQRVDSSATDYPFSIPRLYNPVLVEILD